MAFPFLFLLWSSSVCVPHIVNHLCPTAIWKTRGYGYTVKVADGNATLYEETAISCIVNPFLLMGLLDVQLVDEEDAIVAHLSIYRFVPYFVLDLTDLFQAACANGHDPVFGDDAYIRDALEIFDVLNQTFVEQPS